MTEYETRRYFVMQSYFIWMSNGERQNGSGTISLYLLMYSKPVAPLLTRWLNTYGMNWIADTSDTSITSDTRDE